MSRYYTEADHAILSAAGTFETVLSVAFRVLERMPEPVFLVSGPISTGGLGDKMANVARFHEIIGSLTGRGVNVFDQMPLEEHFWRIMETPYYRQNVDHLLETFYGTLLDSGLISGLYMIPGWQGSYGARWEHDRAVTNGLDITYLSE